MLAATSAASLIGDLAIVCSVAAVTGVAFRLIRQPAILGYLLAGLIIGPYIPIPVSVDPHRIHVLSELGVVLVMFAVGLEFSIRRMLTVLPTAGVTGLVQISLLMWLGFVVGRFFGLAPTGAVVLGASVAISSTMVVAKVFEEQPPAKDVRSLVFGVLVLQDLAAIILIATVTALASGMGLSASELNSTMTRLVTVLTVLLGGGLLVLPRALRFAAARVNPETLVVVSGGVCFGLAMLATVLGYSPALGAFLAGMLVAEAGLAKRVEHLFQPMRDLFAAIFFVSVGMSVDPLVAWAHLGEALVVAVLVILGQFVAVTAAGVLSGLGLRRAVQAGLALGQIGEFAFIIMGVGTAAGLVPNHFYPVIVTVAVLTTFTTPAAIRSSDRIVSFVERRLPARLSATLSLYQAWFDTLRSGTATSSVRRRFRRSVTVVAIDGLALALIVGATSAYFEPVEALFERFVPPLLAAAAVVTIAAVLAFPFALGLLRAIRNLGSMLAEAVFPPSEGGGIDFATTSRRMLVVSLQLLALLAVGMPLVALTQPFLPAGSAAIVLVLLVAPPAVYFWRNAEGLRQHVRAGAEVMLEMLTHPPSDHEGTTPGLEDLLHSLGNVETVELPAEAEAVGRTLAELNLRVETGASVLVIARPEGRGVVAPTGHERLEARDLIALSGGTQAIAAARRRLLQLEPTAKAQAQPQPQD